MHVHKHMHTHTQYSSAHLHLVISLVNILLLCAPMIIDGVVVLGPPVKLHLLLAVWIRLWRVVGSV